MMQMQPPNREEAWVLLQEHTRGESLRKHGLAVEAAMRAYALKTQANPELWGMAGLLHDFDFEAHPAPEEHPSFGCALLKELGYPEELIRAILAHAPHAGVPRVTPLEKTLFAVDELCGFLVACALVQPQKTLAEVRSASVLKKLKDRHFARNVKREHILEGAADLGVDLEEHIGFVLEALRGIAPALGLG